MPSKTSRFEPVNYPSPVNAQMARAQELGRRRDEYDYELIRKRHYPEASPFMRAVLDELEGQHQIGSGKEKVVYNYLPGTVIAFYRQPELKAITVKKEFYARKLFHTILPDHIPDVHLAVIEPSVLVVDKVSGISHKKAADIRRYQLPAIDETLDTFDGVGLEVDNTGSNFILDSEGRAVFIDSVSEYELDIPKVESAISRLTPQHEASATRYLGHLSELG